MNTVFLIYLKQNCMYIIKLGKNRYTHGKILEQIFKIILIAMFRSFIICKFFFLFCILVI